MECAPLPCLYGRDAFLFVSVCMLVLLVDIRRLEGVSEPFTMTVSHAPQR